MKGRKHSKAYAKLMSQDLTRAAEEFDREFVADTFKPLDEKSRARWERVRRKPGRPRVGKGALAISVTVEKDLLARSDALAKKLGITRASLISRGLKAVLAAEGRL